MREGRGLLGEAQPNLATGPKADEGLARLSKTVGAIEFLRTTSIVRAWRFC